MTITYVNNLGLSEMGTGDNSGTWGTVTNTNLELIGQALGHGTRVIADASTDNITMSNGTDDDDRALYLKLTGGGQACTVTLLPATMSKVWIMENGTAAALTFTQGSGANVTIPAGDTKVIACTGGAGTAQIVYDVFASLSVVDLKVQDDLTVTDDVSIGGILGVTGALTVTGGALLNGTTPTLTIGDAGAEDAKIVFDGNAQDFHIGLDDSADSLIVGLGSTLGTTEMITLSTSGIVINEDSADYDFRVESNGLTNAFVIDGGNNGIGFGATPRVDLHAAWTQLFVGKKGSILSELNTGGGVAQMSITDNLYMDSDTGSYAYIETDEASQYVQNAGVHTFRHAVSGSAGAAPTFITQAEFKTTEAVFNSGDENIDFRVESEGNTHMLFVDADVNRVAIGSTGYNTTADLNLLGRGLSIKNDKDGSNNNWSLIQNTGTGGNSNLLFQAGDGNAIVGMDGGFTTNATAGGHSVFNNSGLAVNFTVKSDDNANMLFVDGADDRVGVGTGDPLSGLHLSDGTNAGAPQNAARAATLMIDAGATASADIQLMVRNGYNQHIFFGDAADPNIGMINYDHNLNAMNFTTNTNNSLKIHSTGNVLVNGETLHANSMAMFGTAITIPAGATKFVTFTGTMSIGIAEVSIGFYGNAGSGTGFLKVIDGGHWGGTQFHGPVQLAKYSGGVTIGTLTETSAGWKYEVENTSGSYAATGFVMISANSSSTNLDLSSTVTVEDS